MIPDNTRGFAPYIFSGRNMAAMLALLSATWGVVDEALEEVLAACYIVTIASRLSELSAILPIILYTAIKIGRRLARHAPDNRAVSGRSPTEPSLSIDANTGSHKQTESPTNTHPDHILRKETHAGTTCRPINCAETTSTALIPASAAVISAPRTYAPLPAQAPAVVDAPPGVTAGASISADGRSGCIQIIIGNNNKDINMLSGSPPPQRGELARHDAAVGQRDDPGPSIDHAGTPEERNPHEIKPALADNLSDVMDRQDAIRAGLRHDDQTTRLRVPSSGLQVGVSPSQAVPHTSTTDSTSSGKSPAEHASDPPRVVRFVDRSVRRTSGAAASGKGTTGKRGSSSSATTLSPDAQKALKSLKESAKEPEWKAAARLVVEKATGLSASFVVTSGARHLCSIYSIVASHTGDGKATTPEALRILRRFFFMIETLRPLIEILRSVVNTDYDAIRDDFVTGFRKLLPVATSAPGNVTFAFTIENIVAAFDDAIAASTYGAPLPNPDSFGMHHLLIAFILDEGSSIIVTKTDDEGNLTAPATFGPPSDSTPISKRFYIHGTTDSGEHFWGIHPMRSRDGPRADPMALRSEDDVYARVTSLEEAFRSAPRIRATVAPKEQVQRKASHRFETWKAIVQQRPLPTPLTPDKERGKGTESLAGAASDAAVTIDLSAEPSAELWTDVKGKRKRPGGPKAAVETKGPNPARATVPKTQEAASSTTSNAQSLEVDTGKLMLDPNSPSADFALDQRVEARLPRDKNRWVSANITAVHVRGSSTDYAGPLYDIKYTTNDVATMVPASAIRHGGPAHSYGPCDAALVGVCKKGECGHIQRRRADDFGSLICVCGCHTRPRKSLSRAASGAAESATPTATGSSASEESDSEDEVEVSSIVSNSASALPSQDIAGPAALAARAADSETSGEGTVTSSQDDALDAGNGGRAPQSASTVARDPGAAPAPGSRL